MESSNDCFVEALQKKLKDQGRGAKKRLAQQVGVSANHLSDILGRRKNAGQNLKERMAHALGISFEEILVLGRHIIEEQPNARVDLTADQVKPPESTLGQQAISKTDLIQMASRVLESNSPYRQALTSNITEYYQALESAQKEKKSLQLIKELQEEVNSLRQEVNKLKQEENPIEDSPNSAAA